jgi:poly(ADP-ribose) glycohydrolase ARH3
MTSKEFFTGCLLASALGDALCAPYEGGWPERLAWRLLGKTLSGRKRYTDDTQMTRDVAESLCAHNGINQDHLAKRFAAHYRWSRGYGAGAAKMLKRIHRGAAWHQVNRSVYPDGSYGNGASMRVSPVALYFHDHPGKRKSAVQKISEITHTHPLAIEGAQLIAATVSFALSETSFDSFQNDLPKRAKSELYQKRLQTCRDWLVNGERPGSTAVVQKLGNGIAAVDSCVTAVYIACHYINQPFTDMLRFIQKCSGDTDTIGAMAGAIWGARNGINRLDQADIKSLESAEKIEQLAEKLYDKYFIQTTR